MAIDRPGTQIKHQPQSPGYRQAFPTKSPHPPQARFGQSGILDPSKKPNQIQEPMMTRFAHTAPFQAATAGRSSHLGLIARLRRILARSRAAMEGQARLTALADDTLRDTRLSPQDLTGAPSHDPALPFFLQSGFGRHDR
jgi:hypothetical protein